MTQKSEHFLNEKIVNKTKWENAFASTYNVKTLNSFDPEI